MLARWAADLQNDFRARLDWCVQPPEQANHRPLAVLNGIAVKPDSHDFIGRAAMLERGTPRARVGLKMLGRGIAREHQAVLSGGAQIGHTTSGTHLPYLGGAYAMALIDSMHAQPGAQVQVDVRGRAVDAEIVPLPFYKRAK